MSRKKATNEPAAPLELAKRLSNKVNEAWTSKDMLERVSPITQDLLKFWFSDEYCATRNKNFHIGQRQAILNIIYLHEVEGVQSVRECYEKCDKDLLATESILNTLAEPKYQMPKYGVKMATGTGKTWVMHALLLWQLLNARHEDTPSGRFTKNFLIVAPGIIVYERLLDAFCGRATREQEERNPETNDFYLNQDLFLPPQYRQEVFSFIQNNVVTKEDGIGRKATGDGLIALTNWHLFINKSDELTDEDEQADDNEPTDSQKLKTLLLPVSPGKATGNELGALDRRYLRGSQIEYLADLKDIMVINDEAHHIHDLSKNGEKDEVEWQKGLNAIAGKKGGRYFQIDFTATPYEQRGTGRNVRKAYFPHIVVDFDLVTAIREGLVKTLLIDRRQELTDLVNLTYLAERDDKGKPCALSDGQRLMLRAGLTKLKAWEKEFTGIDERKHPKMLVVCEDTRVSPLVEQFLMEEGLDKDEVLSIDSNKKGEVKEEEWKKIKARLFDIDRYDNPKVIISVLMLREGFDVNNICVIVPLRSTGSQILLEQTIGRGLRLMWREPEYQDMKRENRQLVLQRRNPENYIDMLSIIEHPAFLQFYDELFTAGAAGVEEGDTSSTSSVGDLIKVGLREGYEQYDFEWPVIVREAEEEQEEKEIDMNMLKPFSAYTLEKLRQFLATDGENFVAQELITKTSFGKYKVTADLFSATNYNGYLQKLLRVVTNRFERVAGHNKLPMLQVNDAQIVAAIDKYIRTRLFGQPFNPFNGNDWKILLANSSVVTKHIIEQIARAIHSLQESVKTTDAEVIQMKFSSVSELTMREQYALELTKTIYERQNYPTHGGGLERDFMEFLDKDGEVERFLKINEHLHHFASICYIRTDGLLATYHPDFLVATAKKVYLIETKGRDKIDDRNVRQKQTAAALWIKKINELKPEMRMGREWEYVLIGEEQFYTLSHNGATLADICNRCKISLAGATGDLYES